MGFSASGAKSQSESGLTGNFKPLLSGRLFNQTDRLINRANLFADSDPRAINVGGQRFTGQDIFPLNEFLLPVGTGGAIKNLARLGFNQVSGLGGLRGQLRPGFEEGLVGSVTQNLAGQLLPLMTQIAQFQRLLPENLKANRLGFLERPLLAGGPLLGSSSNFLSSGIGASFTGMTGGGGGSSPTVMG